MSTEIQSSNNLVSLFLIFGLLLGVLLSLTNLPDKTTIGIIIYGFTSIGVLLYGLHIVKQIRIKGIIIILTGLISTVGTLSALLQWPYAFELRVFMVIPVFGFLYLLTEDRLTKPEIGLLFILNIDLLIKIVQVFG